MLLGSINHVSITVSDLAEAMEFFGPLLGFLGYGVGEVTRYEPAQTELTVNLNPANGTAINIWQAKPGHAGQPFEVYAPGLHHLAFNVETRDQVGGVHELVRGLGAEILDGPGEFPFAPGGYYAVYFVGPDGLKLEVVHMPLAEQNFRAVQARLNADSGS